MERLERLRRRVDRILLEQSDNELRHDGFAHLYGVSVTASLLAARRGLVQELCAAGGMLHDLYTYETGEERDHARHGAEFAACMLRAIEGFTDEEIDAVVTSIRRHSDKGQVDGPYDECLKDADVLQHWLYEAGKKFNRDKARRLRATMAELGLAGVVREEE